MDASDWVAIVSLIFTGFIALVFIPINKKIDALKEDYDEMKEKQTEHGERFLIAEINANKTFVTEQTFKESFKEISDKVDALHDDNLKNRQTNREILNVLNQILKNKH